MRTALKQVNFHGALLILFMISGITWTHAQTPIWSTSKDVQKIANKKMFTDINLRDSHIQAQSVPYPAVTISKGVQGLGRDLALQSKGNVISKGYPDWIISKGVQRIGRK